MCEFISWKSSSDGKRVFFLTDNDVFSPYGRKTLGGTRHNDALGHGAITAYFGEKTDSLLEHENKRFWNKRGIPEEIAKYLKSPKIMLATWGKMLRQYLEEDDALFILRNAPKPWKSALMNVCIGVLARESDTAYSALREIRNLSKKHIDILIGEVINNADYAYETLRDITGLTSNQKDSLINALIKDVRLAYGALRDFKGLSPKQRNALVKIVAENLYCSQYYSNLVLLDVKDLTPRQIKLLTKE